MKCAARKIRSPLKVHGGKSYLARRFIDLFSEHEAYVEPFAGGLSVLLNKPKSAVEVAGDLDSGLIEMYRDLKNYGYLIKSYLDRLEYSQHHFDAAKSFNPADPERGAFEATVAFIVRNRMSRGGLGRDFAWSDRLRGGQPGDVNAWQTFVAVDLPAVVDRIQDVRFLNKDALEVVGKYANPGTLIYADPPYLHETRTHKTAYRHEMGRDDHHDLISALKRASERGTKVFLSGYDHPLYREWIPGDWTVHEFSMPNHSGQGKVKQRRVECLWESPS